MTVLYKLAEAQLSKQYHYDFKLRALKSVLVMAGGLKRAAPEFDESTILMRALRDMNMPKFVFADVPLFRGLIGDLFPGSTARACATPRSTTPSSKRLDEGGYQTLEDPVDKVVQLYETLMTRHTTMIVGPPAAARPSRSARSAGADSRALPTKHSVINPKAQPIAELYGELDPATRDWTDGLLSNIFRDMNKPVPRGQGRAALHRVRRRRRRGLGREHEQVMDDNKLLTLPNGERIRLNFHVLDALRGLRPAVRVARDHLALRHGVRRPQGPRLAAVLWKWLNTRTIEAEIDGEVKSEKAVSVVDVRKVHEVLHRVLPRRHRRRSHREAAHANRSRRRT